MHLASVIDLFTHNTHAHTTHTYSQRHTRDNKSTDWPNWPTERTNRREVQEGRVSKGHATDQRRFRPRPRVRVRFRSLLPLLCSLPRATVADTNHLRPSLRSVDAICNDIFIYTLVFFPSLFPLSVSLLCVPWGQLCYFRFRVVSKQGREEKKAEEYWSVMVKWLDPWRSGPQGKGHTSSLPYHVISLICLQWENGNWITWPAPMPPSGLYSKVCQHKLKKNLLYLTGFGCLKLTVSPAHSLQGFRFLCGMCLGVQRGGK